MRDIECDRDLLRLPDYCKAELVVKLLKLGWEKQIAKPDPHKVDKKLWAARLWGSKWYLITMLTSQHVFKEGLIAIAHDRPEGYFKCCYNLANLSELKILDDHGRQHNDKYMHPRPLQIGSELPDDHQIV